MDALFTEHVRTVDNAAGDWALEASFEAAFEAAFGGSPCHERDDCIGHCPTCHLMDTAEPEPWCQASYESPWD